MTAPPQADRVLRAEGNRDSSGGRDASVSRPSLHDPLDYAHRQTCGWCAEHYADLAADAADDDWDEAAA